MSVHLLGIRHHGPGSARNVKAYLEELHPDIILVEGPPEAEEQLKWVIHKDMKPPVAILAYMPDMPQKAVFYPFAEFSPEWQALYHGIYNNIPTRFFDLPLVHGFALDLEAEKPENPPTEEQTTEIAPLQNFEIHQQENIPIDFAQDPFNYLAEAAGVDDGETWWEQNFEHRKDNHQVFEAVTEAVSALREAIPEKENKREQLREAWMRKMVKAAEKEGYARIAVICGAWHVPALTANVKAKDDNELLKGLPKVKIETTWIPWTYNRLTFKTGYGAGIHSPGWYHHLWHHPNDDGTLWLVQMAHMLRGKNMDTSSAHVLEGVRLANSLASLRNHNRAGLEELNEATVAIMGFGDHVILQLIRDELTVGNKIGEVPAEVSKVPLLTDLERLQKRLRMPADGGAKEYNLDLRQPNDLTRSELLHRLTILDITWGQQRHVSGKGTFKEQWILQWQPEYSIKVIEQGIWGNTIEEAASAYLVHLANQQTNIVDIAQSIERAIPANLPKAVAALINTLDQLAATSNNVVELMKALPSIVNVSRYGNVRNTDTDMLLSIAKVLITRICIGLPAATVGVDEDAAQHLLEQIRQVDTAINLLQMEEQGSEWNQTLVSLQANDHVHALLAGYACRLLFNNKQLAHDEVAKRFGLALSTASEPMMAAFWVEGFLQGSGTILLLDENLWSILDNWVASLDSEVFKQLLPLLRRTFAEFTPAERRKLGEKAKSGPTIAATNITNQNFNHQRAITAVPMVLQLLGIKKQEP